MCPRVGNNDYFWIPLSDLWNHKETPEDINELIEALLFNLNGMKTEDIPENFIPSAYKIETNENKTSLKITFPIEYTDPESKEYIKECTWQYTLGFTDCQKRRRK